MMSTNLDRLDAGDLLQPSYLSRVPGELECNAEKAASAATSSPYDVTDQRMQLLHRYGLRNLDTDSARREGLRIKISHFCIPFQNPAITTTATPSVRQIPSFGNNFRRSVS